ncbi:4296_t:CDS:2 [Entrophospora sp. SA101]|nr:4296_t:CDS:2 [Entrophospora sp. SA101]
MRLSSFKFDNEGFIDNFGNSLRLSFNRQRGNGESIDTESDIDLDDYEYYDNHNRDIDFLIEDYMDLKQFFI